MSSRRRKARGIITLGGYELDLGALAQVFTRPACLVGPAVLVVLLLIVGFWQPWKLLRGQGTVIVQAPAGADWMLEGVERRGPATVQVRAGTDTLEVAGDGAYYPATASVVVGRDVTTTVVIADALQWLTGTPYSGTVIIAWPKPTILDLPKEVRRVRFPSAGSEMAYEARSPYESWRAYLLDADGRIARLAWIEALGGLWALAPDGEAMFARNNQVGLAANLADITIVYTTTSAAEVTALYRLTDSWLVVLDEGGSQGCRLVAITDQGRATNRATFGQGVEVGGEVTEGILLRLGGGWQLLTAAGEISYLGDTASTFPSYATDSQGFIYWLGPDLSSGAKDNDRAVWRAPLSSQGATTLAAQVTAGADVAGVLAVREDQVYYVVAQKGEFVIAQKNADGSGQGTLLRGLGVGGRELWPSPDLRRWLIVDENKRYRVLDFGRLKP